MPQCGSVEGRCKGFALEEWRPIQASAVGMAPDGLSGESESGSSVCALYRYVMDAKRRSSASTSRTAPNLRKSAMAATASPRARSALFARA